MKAKTKRTKKPRAVYFTVGVRFLTGTGHQIYTYRIRSGAKVFLGQSLVADTSSGSVVVAVVRIDKERRDTSSDITYEYLTEKVVSL